MERLTVNHLFEVYELYQELYGRAPGWKTAESDAMSFAMACLASRSKKQKMLNKPHIDFAAEGFTVLEVFSGRGEHYKHLNLPDELKLNKYHHLDMVDHSAAAPDFVLGNVMDVDLKDLNLNCIVAPFYSVSTVFDEAYRHTRANLLKWFSSMRRSLREGGGLFIDYAPNGYNQGLYAASADDAAAQKLEILPNRPLRRRFSIPYDVKCTVELSQKAWYDRMTATFYEQFSCPISVNAGSQTVAQVTVRQPLTQRYFTEPELVDVALETGFRDILFFCNDYSDGLFELLDSKLETTDYCIDDDNVEQFQSNGMMFIA